MCNVIFQSIKIPLKNGIFYHKTELLLFHSEIAITKSFIDNELHRLIHLIKPTRSVFLDFTIITFYREQYIK